MKINNNDTVKITLKSGLIIKSKIKLGKQLNNSLKVIECFFFTYKNKHYFLPLKTNKNIKIEVLKTAVKS
jgi:hypothetical protein